MKVATVAAENLAQLGLARARDLVASNKNGKCHEDVA